MTEAELEAYKASLTPSERQVLDIAAQHLKSSFDLPRTIGFVQWQDSQVSNDAPPPEPEPEPKARPRRRRRLIRRAPVTKAPSS